MIASWICGLALGVVQGPGVVQKTLPNGATFRVEEVANSETVTVALYASEASLPMDGGTPGTRHLLEHLIAKGPDGLIDTKLESVGLSLTAFTERDGTGFVIMGPASQVVLAVESLRDLLEPLNIADEMLATEMKILDQEWALRSAYEPFLDKAWDGLFDPRVQSVFGDLKQMRQFKPTQLQNAGEAMMASGGLSVFVRGNVDASVVSLRLTEVLDAAPLGQVAWRPRGFVETIGKKDTVQGKGVARAVVAAGLDRPMTLARLGTALAFKWLEPGFEVVYEPSFDRGPILLYGREGGAFRALDKYDRSALGEIAPLVRLQALRLVSDLERESPVLGTLMAKKLRQAPAFEMSRLRSTARGLTEDEIWLAIQDWKGGAMHLEGLR